MSAKPEELEEVLAEVPKLNGDTQRSRPSVEKRLDLGNIANEDTQAGQNFLERANSLKSHQNNEDTKSSRSSVEKRLNLEKIANEDTQVGRNSVERANSLKSHQNNEDTKRSRSSVEKRLDLEKIANEDTQGRRISLERANSLKSQQNNGDTKRSRSSVEKCLDLEKLANEETHAGRNSFENAKSLKSKNTHNDNRNSTARSFGPPIIEDKGHDGSFAQERHDQPMQQVLGASKCDGTKLNEEEKPDDNCADECTCKIKQALGLIIEEIKTVDSVIKNLSAKAQCPYTPKPDEKKEFAKSVQKNSSVCHVIIGELKKQRVEINEMLQLYEQSTQDFSKIEDTLKQQGEKIKHVEAVLASLTETLNNVKYDIAKRQESFQLEMKSRRARAETREEILSVFLNWISSLNAKRREEQEAADLRVEEAIKERERDRALLTLSVRQLQEVRKIEILLTTQQTAASTRGRAEDISDVPAIGKIHQAMMIPASFCGCSSPIPRVAVISGQCAETTRGCDPLRRNLGPAFIDNALKRCAGGADNFTNALPIGPLLRNNTNAVWDPRMQFGYAKIFRGPRIQQRRVPIARRKFPSPNNSRRQKLKITNVCLDFVTRQMVAL